MDSHARRSAATRLRAFVAGAPRRHGPLALERVRIAFLDTIGCMLLGAPSGPTRIVRAAAEGWGQGPAMVGTSVRAAPPVAALANGTAAHAYDLDDYEDPGNTHPSAVLVPALLALAAGRKVSGAEIADAYIVGLEAIMRVGEAVNYSHYNMGWHSTRTLGTLGAAAAGARLLRLDPVHAAHAIGLSTSMWAGFTSQFGTTAKPLHAGLAAQGGVMAAGLAAAGASAGPDVLDGRASLANLMTAPGEARFGALDRLGEPWGIEEHGLSIKLHSCCGYTHRALDAALRIRARTGFTAALVGAVRVSLTEPHRVILPFDAPQTPAEALFSIPFTVAVALSEGAVTPDDFTEAAIADPARRALAAKVTVETRAPRRVDVSMDPEDPDRVEVTLADGAVLVAEVGAPKGTPPDPLSEAEVLAKFRRSAAVSADAVRVEAIAAACGRLDHLADAGDLTRLLGSH